MTSQGTVVPWIPSINVPDALYQYKRDGSRALCVDVGRGVHVRYLAFYPILPLMRSRVFRLFIIRRCEENLMFKEVQAVGYLCPDSVRYSTDLGQFGSSKDRLGLRSFFVRLRSVSLHKVRVRIMFVNVDRLEGFKENYRDQAVSAYQVVWLVYR